MGAEVGGNGSVHWRIKHNWGNDIVIPMPGQAGGKDPNNSEYLTVEVIYDSPAEATAGLAAAHVVGTKVVLKVKAHIDSAPGYSARAQVKVDW
jgi:hypothetical protein